LEKVTVLESLYEFRTRPEPLEGTALVFGDGEVVAGKRAQSKPGSEEERRAATLVML
jgi:hypothetical protein